jgi:hypothetical protein
MSSRADLLARTLNWPLKDHANTLAKNKNASWPILERRFCEVHRAEASFGDLAQ